jgi:triosephosphate isomerase
MSSKKIGTTKVLQNTTIQGNTEVPKGYIIKNLPTQTNTFQPNVAVGGVYQRGNQSRSLINLNNLGTLIGSTTLENDTNAEKSTPNPTIISKPY